MGGSSVAPCVVFALGEESTGWSDPGDRPSTWIGSQPPALCGQSCHIPWGDAAGPTPPLLLQHIGLPMFAADRKPKRIHLMSLGVLNLPRNALLDWAFGHSLISCHVEHHLFPGLSDNMCLKVSWP